MAVFFTVNLKTRIRLHDIQLIGLERRDHDDLASDVASPAQAIVLLALAQGVAVNICSEIADCGCDSAVEGATKSEVTA